MRLGTLLFAGLTAVVFWMACNALGQAIDQWIAHTVGV